MNPIFPFENVEYLSLDELTPYHNNPRDNEDTVPELAHLIEEYGFTSPILADKERVIIAGHTRYLAARRLRMAKVPVIILDLPPEKAKAYRIADNKVSEKSTWNTERLREEFRELEEMIEDLTITGFSEKELGKLFAEVEEIEAEEIDEVVDGTSFAVLIPCDSEEQREEVMAQLKELGLNPQALRT